MFFTHSFNTHKTYEYLKNNCITSGVYLNKLNESKNLSKIVKRYEALGEKVIIDSPIYASTMIAGAENFKEMLAEKQLSGEVLQRSVLQYRKDPEQFIIDVRGCWDAYLDSIKSFEGSVKKVLSLPSYKSMSEATWSNLFSAIPTADYEYLSFAISNSNTDKLYLDELFNRVRKISETKGIKKFLFTHLRDFKLYEYTGEEVANINNFLDRVSSIGEVVVHHMNDYIFYLKKAKNIIPSVGYYNQTKFMCKESHPFILEENAHRRKTEAVFVHKIMSEVKIDKLIANEKAGNIYDENAINEILSMTKKNAEELGVARRSISMLYEFNGYKKVIGMGNDEKKLSVERGLDFMDSLTKRQQKEILYPITANLYKKIL